MKKVSFFNRMYDALSGILTTSRDVACRVSTTTTANLLKRLRAVILLCGLLCTANMTTHAQSGATGSLEWSIDNGTLTISGTGAMPNYTNAAAQPWATHRSAFTNVVIGNAVTAIGNNAFRDCSITSVTIPASVTSIGTSAFEGCRDLIEVTIPNSVTSISNAAFNDCSALTHFAITPSEQPENKSFHFF